MELPSTETIKTENITKSLQSISYLRNVPQILEANLQKELPSATKCKTENVSDCDKHQSLQKCFLKVFENFSILKYGIFK